MENFILGTAGHIDHGKSSLIKALTGIETDRLEEEKKRGISIVLGYANMILPSASGAVVGIIDVPGHAKFVKTMVSGSTGMNGVLLVIAADDGIMAQTEEHLLILKLLGVNLIVPVLTKIDLADDETLLKREQEIKEFLKSYGFKDASENIFKVSVKDNRGINELKLNIEKAIENQRTNKAGYEPTKVFLPIDRIISLKGFGTILAGTLKYGSFSVNDEMQIMPSGMISKVKNIESHNRSVSSAGKNMRIAVNVPSVEKEKIKYGDVLCRKDSLLSSDSLFTRLYYYSWDKKELKSHSLCAFMTGGTNTVSRVIVLNESKKLSSGNYSFAALKLQNNISSMQGERFIIRDIGAAKTVGGGVIIDPSMDYRYDESKTAVYNDMLSDNPATAIKGFISLYGTCAISELYRKFNLNYSDFISFINEIKKTGDIITDEKNRIAVLKEEFEKSRILMVKIIKDYAASENNILKKGIGKQELMHIFNKNGALFELILDDLLQAGEIIIDGGNILIKMSGGASNESLNMSPEYKDIAFKIEQLLNLNGNSVPSPDEIEKKLKINKKTLNLVISLMAKEGRLIKIKHDIYYLKDQFDKICAGLILFFENNPKLEPKDMKEIAGVSRKYAIPLLEYFDRSGLTVKVGDYRIKI